MLVNTVFTSVLVEELNDYLLDEGYSIFCSLNFNRQELHFELPYELKGVNVEVSVDNEGKEVIKEHLLELGFDSKFIDNDCGVEVIPLN